MTRQDANEVFFEVDARHIRQLGRELVGDRITAVSELVKNAYDADATAVAVEFELRDTQADAVRIVDNGNGMTLSALRSGWMRISTADKDEHPVSPRYKRTRAGRKGIGRFATETLGDQLELRTSVRGQAEMLVVQFDWTKFASGTELGDIGNEYEIIKAPKTSHGTELIIGGLYHDWPEADVARIRNAVVLLQPPFPVTSSTGSKRTDPGFAVTVGHRGPPSDDAELEGETAYSEFIDAATATMHVKVTKRSARMRVKADRLDLDETIPLPFPKGLGPLSATAAYFVYRQDALGDIKTRTAQAMGRTYGGIRVYRDGLRVMPYGEQGVDWLGLDELQGSRSSTLAAIRNQNWFGQVTIGRDSNPGLIDTASREGLVLTPSYEALRRLLRDALVRGAERVAAARGRKSRTDTKPSPDRTTRKDVLGDAQRELVANVGSELPDDVGREVQRVIERSFAGLTRDAADADTLEQNYLDALLGEIDLLRILASLGTSIAVFNHEVQGVVDNASAAYTSLRATVGTNADPETAAELKAAENSLVRMSALAAYINSYVSVSQRREREEQAIYAVVESFVDHLSVSLARGVKIDWHVSPRALRTEPMTRSELETILINFLTNAVKAMNEEGWEDRRIGISARGVGNKVILRFQDTGVGVEPTIRDSIFEPFVSDSRASVSALGIGTGLGLKIVSDIADSYGGKVELAEPDSGFSTCFELELPRWRKQATS